MSDQSDAEYIRIWNTTVDLKVPMSEYSVDQLLDFLEDMFEDDGYNNGGQITGKIEDFRESIREEIKRRIGHVNNRELEVTV